MKYNSGETSQRTGTFGLGGNVGGDMLRFHYENDYHPGLTKLAKISDGGDRFRTAAGMFSYKDFSLGFNLFTGDPGPSGNRHSSEINGHMTYDGGGSYNPDKYRLGAAYIGYKNVKVGTNSEKIRHAIQNRFAHDILTNGSSKWFKVLNNNWSSYGNVGTHNPFSLW